MSLYIRVQSSFWQHRKTLRLQALIGDAAWWLPLRLWSYASINQPDGDFTDYTAEELAMLVAYKGDACSMLQALQQARFFDGMKIHGWSEHNGYHSFFSERAKLAANARWKGKDKIRKEKKVQERKGKETSIASSMLVASANKLAMPNGLTDSEWISRLKDDKTYSEIDVDREHGKMLNWCKTNQKMPTRRRFINWLNRAEKPMTKPQAQDQGDGYWVKPVWETK